MAAKSHKFHITAAKSDKPLASLRGEHAYTFRARSHSEMMEWWNDIKQLSKVYLTTSEQMDRSGPVPAAVRAVGYRSEEEDEEDEEDGSSVEEEDEEEEYEHQQAGANAGVAAGTATAAGGAGSATTAAPGGATANTGASKGAEEDVPAYSGANKAAGIEIGANGYAVEKKGEGAEGAAAGPSGSGNNGELLV